MLLIIRFNYSVVNIFCGHKSQRFQLQSVKSQVQPEDNGCPGRAGGLWEQPLSRSCAGWVCRRAGLGYPSPVVPGCHVSFPRLWFSWERLGSPGESEMSQEPRALRVCVNCFLPGALGREPRRLSQRLEQYKQMPSTSSTWRRKMSCLASLNSLGEEQGEAQRGTLNKSLPSD